MTIYHHRPVNTIHKFLSIGITMAAYGLSYGTKTYLLPVPYRGLTAAVDYRALLFMIIIIWYLAFSLFDIYGPKSNLRFSNILSNIIKANLTALIFLTFTMYVLKYTDVSRIMMGLFCLFNICLLGLSSCLINKLMHSYWQNGFNVRRILLGGCGAGAEEVIEAFGKFPLRSFNIVGCLAEHSERVGQCVKRGVRIIATLDDLERVVENQVVDEIILTTVLGPVHDMGKYIHRAKELGLTVRILPVWQIGRQGYIPPSGSVSFEEIAGLLTMTLPSTPEGSGAMIVKTFLDYLLAATILAVGFPLLVLISAAIKVTSKGPVLYRQERFSKNGRPFILYKFRTMVVDAEKKQASLLYLNESDLPVFKIKKDPRIVSRVGTFLRRSGLDELPQLINILKGEMSLVGPRPPLPLEVEKYEPWQRRRLSMKPGLTGPWQVFPQRHRINFQEWMKIDLQYIDNWSLGLDAKILLKSVWASLTLTGR